MAITVNGKKVAGAGPAGLSPYQVAKAGGYTGTEQEFNEALAQIGQSGGAGKRVARFTVGTSAAGWTADDCDYLCDGTDDQVEINAAIQALPDGGGEIVILDGTYNITGNILLEKSNVTLRGNGYSTRFNCNIPNSENAIEVYKAYRVQIKDFYINGNMNESSKFTVGVEIFESRYIQISGLYIEKFVYGIETVSTNYNIIICGNYIASCKYSITLNVYYDISVNEYFNSAYCVIENNICMDIKEIGIYIAAKADSNLVIGNMVYKSGAYEEEIFPIKVSYATGNFICNNLIPGKDMVVEGGGNNSVYGNKWKETTDVEDAINSVSNKGRQEG